MPLLRGSARRCTAERAGCLDLVDARLVEAQDVAQDLVSVFAEQR